MGIKDAIDGLLGRPDWDYTEGGFVGTKNRHASHSWSRLNSAMQFGIPAEDVEEGVIAIGENLMKAAKAEYDDLHRLYSNEQIDGRILAMMRAVEWFSDRRGDVWQIMTAPLDIGLQPPIIRHPDKTVVKIFREEYERLGVEDILSEMWLACEQYGQAYPLIVPEKQTASGEPKGVAALTMLNPKHVSVGRAIQPMSRSLVYTPPAETKSALLDLAEEHERRTAQDMFLFTMQEGWNEWIEKQGGFRLDSKYVDHVHHRKHRHRRYALPPAARALDDLSTRLVLDELIRGTIEGVHTQWRVWTLDTPKRGEVTAIGAKIGANRRERTADFVWDARLNPPAVVMPDHIDRLLANETWWRLTLSIYRQLGMFVRIISGEAPSQSSQGSNAEIDVQILIARLQYQRGRAIQWLNKLNKVIAAARGIKELPRISFMPILPEWEAKLRSVTPLLNFGLLSLETVHNWIGLDHEDEIKRLKTEKPLREDGTIQPYTGFAQSGPSGVAQSPQSPGRPRKPAPETSDQNRRNAQAMEAAIPPVIDAYMTETLAAYDAMASDLTVARVEAFVHTLSSLRTYRSRAFNMGYEAASGLSSERLAMVSARHSEALTFDDENLLNFRGYLLGMAEEGGALTAQDRRRAGMYATEGWRKAYMAGVFEAKAEQGFSGWQRVLNWSGSGEGPCEVCIADGSIIHPITEMFWDHVNGVCNVRTVLFSRMGDSGLPLPFKVPTYMPY